MVVTADSLAVEVLLAFLLCTGTVVLVVAAFAPVTTGRLVSRWGSATLPSAARLRAGTPVRYRRSREHPGKRKIPDVHRAGASARYRRSQEHPGKGKIPDVPSLKWSITQVPRN